MKKKNLKSLDDFIIGIGRTFYELKKSNDKIQQAGLGLADESTKSYHNNDFNKKSDKKRKSFAEKPNSEKRIKKRVKVESSDDDSSVTSVDTNKDKRC